MLKDSFKMPSAIQGDVLTTFLSALENANLLLQAANQLSTSGSISGSSDFQKLHLELDVSIAFLYAFTHWESFLEDSFINYLLRIYLLEF